MRWILAVLSLVITFTPFTASASEYEIEQSFWYGDVVGELHFEGEPDEHGLVWMISKPRRAHEPWVAWVYNASETQYFGLKVSLKISSGDKWRLPGPGMGSLNQLVWPYQIDPGAIGVVDLGSVSNMQGSWTDQRVEVESFETEHNQYWSIFTVEDFRVQRDHVSATLINDGMRPLTQIGLRVACVDDGEITGVDYAMSDLVTLFPDESESFRFELDIECDGDWIYTPFAQVPQ